MSDIDYTTTCGCGQPLHYSDSRIQARVEKLIRLAGDPLVTVETPRGIFRVPRHYIALHGIHAGTLYLVAAQYGFERVSR